MLTRSASPNKNGGWSSPAAVLFLRILRPVLALALLWFAVRNVLWVETWAALRTAAVPWMAGAVALVVVDRVLMAWRWIYLLRAVDSHAPLPAGSLVRVFFISGFLSTFVPGGAFTADTLRALTATRSGVRMADAAGAVAVDRLLGTVSVLLMAFAGLMFVGHKVDPAVLLVAAVAAIAAAVFTWTLLFDPRVYAWMIDRVGLNRWPTLDRLAKKFLVALGQYRRTPRVLVLVLVGSIAVQILRTLQVWCLGIALGFSLSATWYFGLVPLVVLVTLLPISVAGLGTSNAAFVELFALAGVSGGDAFALSVLFLVLGLVGTLPGGLLILYKSAPRQRDA